MKRIFKKNKGAIALTAIIIISAVSLIVTMTLASTSLAGSLTRMNNVSQIKIDSIVDGCMEEALIEYKKDMQGYTGSTTSDCTIQITGTSPLITINIAATPDNQTKEIEGIVEFDSDVELTSYREVIIY